MNWFIVLFFLFYFFAPKEKKRFTILITTTPQKSGQSPSITNSGISHPAIPKRIILIIIVNSPKLKIISGKEINFRIGLMKKLIIPKTNPVKIKVIQPPAKSNPCISQAAK